MLNSYCWVSARNGERFSNVHIVAACLVHMMYIYGHHRWVPPKYLGCTEKGVEVPNLAPQYKSLCREHTSFLNCSNQSPTCPASLAKCFEQFIGCVAYYTSTILEESSYNGVSLLQQNPIIVNLFSYPVRTHSCIGSAFLAFIKADLDTGC